MILIFCNVHREGFFLISNRRPGAILYRKLVWCLGTPQSSTDSSKVLVLTRISVIRCTCRTVECFCRNPNWWSGRVWFSFGIELDLLSIAFSKILITIVSRLIGLYELSYSSVYQVSGSLWSTRLSTELGNPVLITALHLVARWIMPFLGISFKILPVSRSYPGAFLGLRFFVLRFGFPLV
jgi:hypothetical protein